MWIYGNSEIRAAVLNQANAVSKVANLVSKKGCRGVLWQVTSLFHWAETLFWDFSSAVGGCRLFTLPTGMCSRARQWIPCAVVECNVACLQGGNRGRAWQGRSCWSDAWNCSGKQFIISTNRTCPEVLQIVSISAEKNLLGGMNLWGEKERMIYASR